MKFDIRISLALLLAFAVQTGGVLLWAGAAAQRLEAVEAYVAARDDTGERLARLETELGGVRRQLDRIETQLGKAHE
jgi:hypothetical protein